MEKEKEVKAEEQEKREVIWFLFMVFVGFLVPINLADVSAETYPCCCEISGYWNGWDDWNKMCVMGSSVSGPDSSSYEASTKCVEVCHEIANSMESSTSYFPHVTRIYSFAGNRCSGKQCVHINYDEPEETEICNGVDDDDDEMVDEDDATCEPSECLAEGDCPLGYVCGFRKAGSVAGTGAVGEEENCEICESKCKVCPPHPPKATKNNPLGICKDYPMSKNCLDWKNKVSCMTCEDKDGDGKRESFKAREDDGNWGVDMNNKPIFREGDAVKSTIKEVVFPNYLKYGPENNKDYKANDEVIDCRLAVPTLYSGVEGSDAISDANAFYGKCIGGICVPPESQSCISDCYWGYEKGFSDGDTKLTEKDLEKKKKKTGIEGYGPLTPLAEVCPTEAERADSSYPGSPAVKYAAKTNWPWGAAIEDTKYSDCYISTAAKSYLECGTMDRKVEKPAVKVKDLQEKCVKKYGEKRAYYYSITGGSIKSGTSNCFCAEAKIDLEPWSKTAFFFAPDKSKIKLACLYPESSASCMLPITQILINQNRFSPGDIKDAFDSIKIWILG